MRLLWNHDKIKYGATVQVANPDGSTRAAHPVHYEGTLVGYVGRAEGRGNGWAYLLEGDQGQPWTYGGGWARKDAADQLLSHWNPGPVAWLS